MSSMIGSCENEYVVVNSLTEVSDALAKLHELKEVTLHCEGLHLGSRASTLTHVVVSAVGVNAVAYVFDVTTIGKSLFQQPDGLKSLLESPTIRKVVYDCRTASDVLFHHHQVTLQNSLDLQVYLQAIQMVKGTYSRQDLPSLDDVGHQYVDFRVAEKLRADAKDCLAHAAFRCLLVNYVYLGMKEFGVPVQMIDRIQAGSAAYERKFRDLENDLEGSVGYAVQVMKQDPI